MPNNLNQFQKKCVTYGTGPLLVLAGPGSGKTHTLVRRIAYLVESECVQQSSILVITYTKDAALSMQRRYIKNHPNSNIYFGTFHSVFFSILKNETHKNYNLIDLKTKQSIIMSVLFSVSKKHGLEIQKQYLEEESNIILSLISKYKSNISFDEVRCSCLPPWQDYLTEIMEDYDNEIKTQGYIDFEDMIYQCRMLLSKNPYICEKYKNMFSHILIDEFQDINMVQYETLKLITGEQTSIFAVGDDDQSIYGFRGASPACMKKFVDDFGAEIITLGINYRSGQTIIDAANKMISKSDSRFIKKVYASDNKDSVFSVKGFLDEKEEAEYIISKIDDKRTVILFRTNSQMYSYLYHFRAAGIEPELRNQGVNLSDNDVTIDLLAYLNYSRFYKTKDFCRIMNRPKRYITRNVLFNKEYTEIDEVISAYDSIGNNTRAREILHGLHRMKKEVELIRKLPINAAVTYVFKACGLKRFHEEAAITSQKLEEIDDVIKMLETISEDCDSVEDFVRKIYDTGYSKKKEKSKVSFMTVHASKGLEFDKVFIPDCNERNYPHGISLSDDELEEERRIFYVAMTRAASELHLLYLENKKNPDRRRSRFIDDIVGNRY